MKRWVLSVVTVSAICGAVPRLARAEDPRPAYQLSFQLDASLLLIAGGMASSYLFLNEAGPPSCAPLCDRANVNPLDRPFAGLYDPHWETVGNIATASVFLLVPAGLIAGEPNLAGLSDLLVVGEAVLVTSAIQVPMSYAVNRPRPRVYGTDAPLDQRNNANAGRSFFSGHAADCLAGTLVVNTALRRVGRPRLAWAVLSVGLLGSALVGISRVAAGGHFPSDVIVGYAVGAGVGIAIPALHDLRLQPSPMALPAGGGLNVAGRF